MTAQELNKIFSNKTDREIFIGDYKSFQDDGFLPFYEKFIHENYSSNAAALLIQVMDLSVNIDYFDEKHLLHYWNLYGSKKFEYRLTFLDYLYFFNAEIKPELYAGINAKLLATARNMEIRFQACINLCVKEYKYVERLLALLKDGIEAANHYMFYRALSFVEDQQNSRSGSEISACMRALLNEYPERFPAGQRADFLAKLA